MRRLWFSVALITLLAGLMLLRRYRFERLQAAPVTSLQEVRCLMPLLPPGASWTNAMGRPGLRLALDGGHRNLALRTELPEVGAVEALHIRFRMAAKDLIPGKQEWEDGRLFIEWRSPDGALARESDPVCSLRNDEKSGEVSLVVRPLSSPSLPILHIENLGQSGVFEVTELEMTPVRERILWRIGRWVLLGAWFLWLYAVLSVALKRMFWRRCLAAAMWIGLCVWFVFPGPWKTLRPMVLGFDLGEASGTAMVRPSPTPEVKSAEPTKRVTSLPEIVEPVGRIQPVESWMLTVKRVLSSVRPLLHMLLLGCPTLAFAFLLGGKPALWLGGSLALSIEAAQTAFGYGFDFSDIGDLASDAAGIALALWIWKRFFAKP